MIESALENTKHPKWKMFLYYAAFFCLMLAGFLMVFSLRNKSAQAQGAAESNVPGDVMPRILVGDTVYYWSGMSQKHTGADTPGKRVSVPSDGSTYLPEGFTEYGSFLATVDTPPAEELQLQADFSAFGTVYRNPDAPEVLYILMTTDWFESRYVRFASREIFDGDRIAWGGTQYCAMFRKGTDAPLEKLPKGAVSIGTLHYIGRDYMPEKDLETNCISDDYAMSLEGREVFADPNEPDCLYVYSTHLNSGGGYYKCPVWKESHALQHVA